MPSNPCYTSNNGAGAIYCFSTNRPAADELVGIKMVDLLDHNNRIDRCIFHSKKTGQNEVLVWTFKNGTMLAPKQAALLHGFWKENDAIVSHFASTDRKFAIIKTIHDTEILVVLACQHSKFHVEPSPPSNGHAQVCHRPTQLGMTDVISELQATFGPENTTASDEGTTSVAIDLVTPGSNTTGGRPSGGSEFTFESVSPTSNLE
ncbi:hypothetical protein SEMRO_599_G173310.1 [Seminavis robusta]|uniref:Uncharacterized protein n=1 Tax=Seminavis robusta TaxID=568900 RepID=A0A9N8E6F1_9STRA|nr:hypothetical protein SEMRO_599_G173310.1 [Seminavis robusta]|eukprot:Sro599_g173310.1 n/a (205) ;mRNA; r:44704-45318